MDGNWRSQQVKFLRGALLDRPKTEEEPGKIVFASIPYIFSNKNEEAADLDPPPLLCHQPILITIFLQN